MFADDDRRWTYPSRFVATTRSDADGHFRLPKLPPAAYLAVAVSDLEDGGWTDPAVLDSLRGPATPFILDEGETQALSLGVSPRP